MRDSDGGKPRSIELFFVRGEPDGMLTGMIPFQWTGHVLMTNRAQLTEALQRPEASRPGVYLLLGEDENGPLLYIGESDDIAQRIKTHDAKKDWWSSALLITSFGEQLNKAHAKYLESRLIEEAKKIGKIRLDNGNTPSLPVLSEAATAHMEDFIDNILLVLPVLRIDFFRGNTRAPKLLSTKGGTSIYPTFVLETPKHGIEATAALEDGRFVVEAGSKARTDWVGTTTLDSGYARLHQELIQRGILVLDGEHRKFSQRYAFDSASAAGAVVNGRPTAGPLAWKLKGTNTTYKQWEQEQLARN